VNAKPGSAGAPRTGEMSARRTNACPSYFPTGPRLQ
jgi:hypothetical protein